MTRTRTAVLAFAFVGATFASAPVAFAQSETTVAAVAETTAAAEPAAEAAATEAAVEAVAETAAAAPEGAVAAGGGFLDSDGSSNTLPLVLAGAGLVAGAGVFAARRRRA